MTPLYSKHSSAIVEPGALIGAKTRVWAYTHVLAGAKIGEDCNICDYVFIEGNVEIGDRVTIKCGVQLWSGLRVGDDVFIGPNVAFTNDRFPRSKRYLEKHPETILEDGCSLGANATVLPGLTVGRNAMVGAGAVVTRSVPPNAIVTGNPAEIVGYDTGASAAAVESDNQSRSGAVQLGPVPGVALHTLPLIQDIRGDLSVGEFGHGFPFQPKRYFVVFNVKRREIRGEHAHRECSQFLVCVAGSCRVMVDNGTVRAEYLLDAPNRGLLIPPMVWATQYKHTPDGVLLVFASHHYDKSDYIRNYDVFLKEKKDVT